MKKFFILILMLAPLFLFGQQKEIQVGSFNLEWFPCKDDGEMMKQYGINLRQPPTGNATNIPALFDLLKKLDIELLGVVEVVDTDLLEKSAQEFLGPEFKFVYAPSAGSQKVGFLYDSSVLEIIGQPEIYASVKLKPNSWLRPAFRGYFKVKPNGMDFQAIIAHLKAGPSGWNQRQKQWKVLERILQNLPETGGDKDIILMGDFNNVSKFGYDEFRPVMERLNFRWANQNMAQDSIFSNYWRPDYTKDRIQGSLIDQIFLSDDALQEYVPHSVQVGGMCSGGANDYEGDEIPDYYEEISDHCPVFVTFKADKDND